MQAFDNVFSITWDLCEYQIKKGLPDPAKTLK